MPTHARDQHPSSFDRIELIGLPTDAGASCRGAALGPDGLRAAGLAGRLADAGYEVTDLGNVMVDRDLSATCEIDALAARASLVGYRCLKRSARPVFLGGDHSISMGSVAGVARYCREIGRPLFVLWFDAHGDFNTHATSETGNIHGMSLARLCGEAGFDNHGDWYAPVDPRNTMVFGARSLDCEEAELLDKHAVQVVDMDTIRLLGAERPIRDFLDRVAAHDGHLHLSLDVDAMDPELAPGVGTTVPGGLDLAEAETVMDLLARSGAVGSLDLVELNPVLDRSGMSADLMVDLALRTLGKGVSARAVRELSLVA